MVDFKPASGKIVLPSGKLIDVQHAKRLQSELETAIDLAESYESADALQDIGTNETAVQHLLDPTDSDHLMKVEASYEDGGGIAEEYVEEILKHRESHGLVDVLVEAHNIRPLFDASTNLTGFHVMLPKQ